MENLHLVPPPDEDEEYTPPLLILDDITIIDAKGWSFLRSGSKKDSDEVVLAIELAKEIELRIAENDNKTDIWEENSRTIMGIWEEIDRTIVSRTDSRTLFWAIIILRKHWLYGEKIYAAYSKSH